MSPSTAGLHAVPLRAPGLGGIFNQLQPALLCEARESPRQHIGRRDEPAEWRARLPGGLSSTRFHRRGLRLKVTGSMSASTGFAPARRIALTEAKKLNGVVTTAAPGPMPAAASASHKASVPDEQPMACATPNCLAAALSNAATCSPRMNCRESSTWSAPAFLRMGGTGASRSSMGTGGGRAPDVSAEAEWRGLARVHGIAAGRQSNWKFGAAQAVQTGGSASVSESSVRPGGVEIDGNRSIVFHIAGVAGSGSCRSRRPSFLHLHVEWSTR